jgi:glycerol-3-phosphate dehydrogenase (NAD(P)+)
MSVVTILGAGYMGSALTVPATDNGHEVRLWGTWLDDDLIGAVRAGRDHPRLEMRLPDAVQTFTSEELEGALDGADLVICGVTSEGIERVMERAFAHMDRPVTFMAVTKGLLPGPDGHMDRLSRTVAPMAHLPFRYGHIGGPSKAMELARRIPTAVVYAGVEAGRASALMRTPYYHITISSDLAGVETCSALKNAYAISAGLFDGLQAAGVISDAHNAKSAIFSKAVREMALAVGSMGGRPETVFGLAGVGDLLVTAVAGRNRTFGEMVGKGMPPAEVVVYMSARDQLTEGYTAIRTGWALVNYLAEQGSVRLEDFALLCALHTIVYESAPVQETLYALDLRE